MNSDETRGGDRSVRVLVVTPMYPPDQAGVALQASLLVRTLRAQGHRAIVLTFTPRDLPSEASDKRDEEEPVIRIDREWRGRKLALGIAAVCAPLVANADVVHAHGYGRLTQIAWAAAKSMRRPFVVTFHGTEVWDYVPKRIDMFRLLCRRAHVVCVSGPLADVLAEKTGIYPRVVEPAVASPFVDVSRSLLRGERTPPPIVDRDPIVLNVKGLYPVNRQERLIDVFPFVRERVPDAELWLVGEGPLRAQLERRAAEQGIASAVRFFGLVENVELVGFYGRARVFVNVSAMESYGNVIVEALSCGTPAVATETPGTRLLVKEFPNDLDLIAPEGAAALSERIVDRLSHPRDVCEETLQRIVQTKSAEAMTRKYLAIYKEAHEG